MIYLETESDGNAFILSVMDGEYSKLEKDFLGNERMVHYNAEGVAVSASKVDRGEDGSMTVGEPVPLIAQPQSVKAQPLLDAEPRRKDFPPGTIATIGIASFIFTALAALYILNSNRPATAAERFNTAVYREPVQVQPPPAENLEQVPGPQELDAPVPRQEDEVPPGDRNRPRIDLRGDEPTTPEQTPGETPEPAKPAVKPKQDPPKSSDPIDLRGDGDESR